jgi:hypothetical protein
MKCMNHMQEIFYKYVFNIEKFMEKLSQWIVIFQ